MPPQSLIQLSDDTLAIFLALCSTICFSSASLVFANYSSKISVLWMNTFKAFIAAIALLLILPFLDKWIIPSTPSVYALLLSGLIGLNIADLFLLRTFTRIGVARTLMLFGFQPFMVGAGAYYFFGQAFETKKLLALVFFIACLFIFSWERFRKEKRWELAGLLMAMTGVALDSSGILLTRWAYAQSPELMPAQTHLIRCIGALLGFFCISFYTPIDLLKNFRLQVPRIRTLLIVAALGGTFISLLLNLAAIKIGHLASISGVAITGPMFATLIECIIKKQKPAKSLLVASVFFVIGFWILIRS